MSVQIGKPNLRLEIATLIDIADASFESARPTKALPTGSRLREDDAYVDIWQGQREPLPDAAVLVMIHRLFFQIEWFYQAIWFRRTEQRDELWAATIMDVDFAYDGQSLHGVQPEQIAAACEGSTSRVFGARRADSFDESLIELLCSYFATGGGGPWGLDQLVATAYVGYPQFRLLYQRLDLHREECKLVHERNIAHASCHETEIVRVARELGLDPRPSGDGPTAWDARCPGQNGRYTLWISAGAGQFGCPYCRVKGGIDELRAFISKRSGSSIKSA